ncbi:MAG: hypothetical protein RJA99_2951 [Pseudomonadota bacterium]|jgi:type IV pilus assembly protein PilX
MSAPACRRPARSAGRDLQRGVTLLIVLLLTALAGMIAMSQASSLNGLFRTARDERDLSMARQAAEAALRDAEADIACMAWKNGVLTQVLVPETTNGHCVSVAPHCSQMMPTEDGAGIRLLGSNPGAPPTDVDWGVERGKCLTGLCAIELGAKTGAPKIEGVSAQPRYQIDAFDVSVTGTGEPVPLFRITARGYGGAGGTVSELQEVYRPCR